ncbi:MAG: hypothetical protein MJY89_09485 [Bacteroidales bacterium]|nr:hypothetical protein [Bacteroidales bacterium]
MDLQELSEKVQEGIPYQVGKRLKLPGHGQKPLLPEATEVSEDVSHAPFADIRQALFHPGDSSGGRCRRCDLYLISQKYSGIGNEGGKKDGMSPAAGTLHAEDTKRHKTIRCVHGPGVVSVDGKTGGMAAGGTGQAMELETDSLSVINVL